MRRRLSYLPIFSLGLVALVTNYGCKSGIGQHIGETTFASLDNSSVDFGTITPGHILEKTVTLKNSGSGAASTFSFSTAGPLPPFGFKGGVFPGESGDCVQSGLGANASCKLVITFSPESEGTFEQEFVIQFDDEQSSREITLTFSGKAVMCDASISPFGGGDGSASDPYSICTLDQLKNIPAFLDKNFLVVSDLDLSGVDLNPIGTTAAPFTGGFDGGNHTISNFKLNLVTEAAGFFGTIVGAKIANLNFTNALIIGTNDVGTLAGQGLSGTSITNVHVSGNVTATGIRIGGIVGQLISSSMTKCDSTIVVTGTGVSSEKAGGLIGSLQNSTVSESSSSGSVSAGNKTGGAIGYAYTGTLSKLNSSAAVLGKYDVGGLIGRMETGSVITFSKSTGTAGGTANSGGFVGVALESTLEDNYSTTNVSALAGGLSGFGGFSGLGLRSSFRRSFATGSVSGPSWVGGFSGDLYLSTATDSYAQGSVTLTNGGFGAGGFVAVQEGYGGQGSHLVRVYSTGTVQATAGGSYLGGLVGYFEVNSTVTNSYWDKESSGMLNNPAGAGTGIDTTLQMQDPSTYAGWDFISTWSASAGHYPKLPFDLP